MMKSTRSGYGLPAILLHWLMAIGFFGLFGLGKWMEDLDYYHPFYFTAQELHASIGILMGILLVIRFGWKMIDRDRPDNAELPFLDRVIARTLHWLFYALILLLGFSGFIFSTSDGTSVPLFWLVDLDGPIQSKEIGEFAADIHEIIANLVFVLAVLHALAALKHHFYDKDNVLKRMIRPVKP